jgi:hypothetical protein
MPGNGAQFTGTKVQILTPEELRASHQRAAFPPVQTITSPLR